MNTGIYYYNLIQKRRAEPQDDMISRLIETEIERDGQVEKLTDVDIAGIRDLCLAARAPRPSPSWSATRSSPSPTFPTEWQKLRDDRSKIPAAVEELLRYEAPSQYQVRTATRDVTLHGNTIPAGSAVLLVTGSATRDERMFPDPDRLDIDRERKMGFNLALGYGIHSCLGAALARMEGRIALEALLDLIPEYEVDRERTAAGSDVERLGWSNVPVRATLSAPDRLRRRGDVHLCLPLRNLSVGVQRCRSPPGGVHRLRFERASGDAEPMLDRPDALPEFHRPVIAEDRHLGAVSFAMPPSNIHAQYRFGRTASPT